MKCLVQPGDGITPLVKAIEGAKKSVEIVIFRFNRSEIEKALAAAVTRGIHVHALIASTNRGGVQNLRDLEMRLLAAGVTVSRSGVDLVRYHAKLMIIDRRVLFLLAFNLTWLDIERSRSFAIITTSKQHVEQATKLFDADTKRQPYVAGSATFVVSPVNARKQISGFLRGAKKELLIYDPEISDPEIVRLLEARVKAGVTVRIIGKLNAKTSVLPAAKKLHIRLHTRSIVRDGSWAFVGSQSLRSLELDARREVGIIFRDPKVVARLAKTFEADWEAKEQPIVRQTVQVPGQSTEQAITPDEAEQQERVSAAKAAKKIAKAVAEEIPPVKTVFERTVPGVTVNHPEIEESVKQAVREAVRQVVRDFVEEATATKA